MKFQQAIVSENGAVLYLPPNPTIKDLPEPNMYEGTAKQLFPIGTIGFLGQRKFAYGIAGGTLQGWSRLLMDASYVPCAYGQTDVDGYEGAGIYADYAAGTKTIVIDDTATRIANYYEGGFLSIFNADGIRSTTIRIGSSDVAAAADDVVTLHLDDGIPWAIVDGDWCVAYRNPYAKLTEPTGDGYEPFMGLTLAAVTSGHFFWLQIAGPAWIAQSGAATIPGYDVDHREAYAARDGCCIEFPGDATLQRIGYVLGRHGGTNVGDTFIMLQLG